MYTDTVATKRSLSRPDTNVNNSEKQPGMSNYSFKVELKRKAHSREKRLSDISFKTVYMPRFGSKLGSGPKDGPQPDEHQTELPSSCSQGGKVPNGNKRGKGERSRSSKKLKLTKCPSRTLVPKTVREEDKILRRLMPQLAVKINKTAVSQGEETQCANVDSDYVRGDVFIFSQIPNSNKATNEKGKLAVLRTVSKMLEENRCIRQRLASLSQANCASTD